jgi:hypothetical protein
VTHAQTKGRIAVGAGLSIASPADGTDTVVTVSPLTRLPPKDGWRPTIGFNWMTTKIEPGPGDQGAWKMRSRPVMVGVAYTHVMGRSAVNGTFVLGPSFNKSTLRSSGWAAGSSTDAENSIAYRLGGAYNYSLTERVGLQLFAAYMFNRMDVTFHTRGIEGEPVTIERRFKGDTPIFSVSAVYSLF